MPILGRLPAGFPSPADDYAEGKLDLNKHLIEHPAATFFVRVTGDSMIEARIHTGDLFVVDRFLEASDGNVIVAVLDGELTVKRLLFPAFESLIRPDASEGNYDREDSCLCDEAAGTRDCKWYDLSGAWMLEANVYTGSPTDSAESSAESIHSDAGGT